MRGMKETMAVTMMIEKVLESKTKKPNKDEAARILRSCGVLNNKNVMKSVYKGIFIEKSVENNGKK